MKTILALSLIATAFAFIPTADATCDPVTGQVCAGSYGSGTCDNGYAGNSAQYYNYDANGYTYAGLGTYCGGYPGYYNYGGVSGGVTMCDASWNCDYVGVYWDGGNFGSDYCYSQIYYGVDGQYGYEDTGLCAAGRPPVVPSLGLP